MSHRARPTPSAGSSTPRFLARRRVRASATSSRSAMLTPVLPQYVDGRARRRRHRGRRRGRRVRGRRGRAAALRRPDRRPVGRRVARSSAARCSSRSRRCVYGAVDALWWLVAMRVVTGFGEAGVLRRRGDDDHRPRARRPAGRGDLLLVGRGVRRARVRSRARRAPARRRSLRRTFFVSAGARVRRGGARALHEARCRATPAEPRRAPLLHRGRARPGIVLFLGLMPLAGFTAFVPLYVDTDVDASAGAIFLLYGVLILVVRILGARHPRPPRRAQCRRAGAARRRHRDARHRGVAHRARPGVGTIIFAGGMSLMYPRCCCSRSPASTTPSARRSSGRSHRSSTSRGPRRGRSRAPWPSSRAYRGAFAVAGVTCLFGLDDRSGGSVVVQRVASGCDAVAARHQRLPAQDRRHPVVPLRAVAPASAGRDDGAHDAVRGRGASGTPRRRSASYAPARRCCCRRRSLDATSTRSRARSAPT